MPPSTAPNGSGQSRSSPFKNAADYDKIREDDKIGVSGLTTFTPGKPLVLELKHSDGTAESFEVNHTYNQQQIDWFKAGSALNLIAAKGK